MLDFLDKKARHHQSNTLARRRPPQHDSARAKRVLLNRLICPEPTPALVCHKDQLVYRAAWWHSYILPHFLEEKFKDVPDWQLECKRVWRIGFWEAARLDETLLELFLSLAAAKEAAVKRLKDAPAYYRHKGKALEMLSEDINDEGPALRLEAIASIAMFCHIYFIEGDYDNAERHCEALARLITGRLHLLPALFWQFITAADIQLSAVQMRGPRLPYHLHKDFRSLYFYNPSESIVNVTLKDLRRFPVGSVFSVDASHRTKRLLQGLHGLAHAQSRFDLDRMDIWAHIYDTSYLLAQLQVDVERDGSVEESIMFIGCQMQYWGMLTVFVAQPNVQTFQLRQLRQAISTLDPGTLCDRWIELTGSLDLLLWSLCNAGISVLQLTGSHNIATEQLPNWLQPYLEYIFERLLIENDEDLRVILQQMPFTGRWNGRACLSFEVWSGTNITTPSSISRHKPSSPPPNPLYERLRLDFDDWIDV